MAEETVFLSEGGMFVSISRVNLGGTTYATANITSVSKRMRPAKTGCATILIVLGLLMALIFLGALTTSDVSTGLGGLLFAGIILGLGVLWYRSLKPTYLLVFASSSGETEALSSQDQALIDRVVRAVNEAIVARG